MKKALGENHPDYASSLTIWPRILAQGDYARAEPLLRQAVEIMRRQLEATAAVQSERQQLAMLQSVRSYLDAYLASRPRADSTSIRPTAKCWPGKGASCAASGRSGRASRRPN